MIIPMPWNPPFLWGWYELNQRLKHTHTQALEVILGLLSRVCACWKQAQRTRVTRLCELLAYCEVSMEACREKKKSMN